MHDYQKSLGDVVKKARVEQKLTQQGLAEKLNIDVRTIINIENYSGNPKLGILYPLIRALEIDPATIFYPELSCKNLYISQFERMLSQCSEEELQLLIPICETILAVFRSKETAHHSIE